MMLRSSRALSAIAALLLVFAGVLTVGTGKAAADLSCGLEFVPEKLPQISKPIILVEVLVDCKEPPATHDLTLQLQRRDSSGSWVTQSANNSIVVPSPRLRLKATAECGAGYWRGLVHVSGSLQSNVFTFTDWTGGRLVSAGEC